jgi:hypothetical protein
VRASSSLVPGSHARAKRLRRRSSTSAKGQTVVVHVLPRASVRAEPYAPSTVAAESDPACSAERLVPLSFGPFERVATEYRLGLANGAIGVFVVLEHHHGPGGGSFAGSVGTGELLNSAKTVVTNPVQAVIPKASIVGFALDAPR